MFLSNLEWLRSKLKDNRQANSEHYIHELLLEEMVTKLDEANLNEFDEATRNDNVVYNIFGLCPKI